ncbi:MAG: hypothetical protein CSA23_06265 [Deltaproteobacteria bacterium]|nr:MAG: hypothetical protein CSA23_06265 [Deltaproteobacteria bacterium]
MKKGQALPNTADKKIVTLVAKQKLMIEDHQASNVLKILDSNGKISLSIQITEDGPVLKLGGGALTITTEGNLAIDAESVSIHGRKEMALTTEGNFHIEASGGIHSKAQAQLITADLGDIDIKANDDVKLDGERIRLNC